MNPRGDPDSWAGQEPGVQDAFGLQTPTTMVVVDEQRTMAPVTTEVSNALGRRVRAVVEVLPAGDFDPAWAHVVPESFDLDVRETRRVTIEVQPPPSVTGTHSFRLRVYDADHPSEAYATGPAIEVSAQRRARRSAPWWLFLLGLLVLVGVVVLVVRLLGGSGAPPGDPQTPTPTQTQSPTPTPTPTTVTGSPTEPPGPLANLTVTLRECALVPGGSLSGADALTVFAQVRNVGEVPVERLVPYRLETSTGVSDEGAAGIGTGPALNAFQVDVLSSDYGEPMDLVVELDPDGAIAESDDADNRMVVRVDLPASQPVDVVDPLPCVER